MREDHIEERETKRMLMMILSSALERESPYRWIVVSDGPPLGCADLSHLPLDRSLSNLRGPTVARGRWRLGQERSRDSKAKLGPETLSLVALPISHHRRATTL